MAKPQYESVDRLLRKHAPNPVRELIEDVRAAMAATDDPAERRALYQAAVEAAPMERSDSGFQIPSAVLALNPDMAAPRPFVSYTRDGEAIPPDHALLARVRDLLAKASGAEERQAILAEASLLAVDEDEARRSGDPALLVAVQAEGLPYEMIDYAGPSPVQLAEQQAAADRVRFAEMSDTDRAVVREMVGASVFDQMRTPGGATFAEVAAATAAVTQPEAGQ